ncbi:MAG: phosphoribosyltransferase [Helicobacteraceae bacterium]|jgi:xanthine phosphoribosyltransferase|nr:phosphoribosyltransferase [Helicobacteraceae bacterium]
MKIYYPYEQFLADIKVLAEQIRDKNFDAILAISRGGLTIAHFLGIALDTKELFFIRAASYENRDKTSAVRFSELPDLTRKRNILIVDDIVDSGETLSELSKLFSRDYPHINARTLAIFQKTTAKIRADFFARETELWIDFFWEVDVL